MTRPWLSSYDSDVARELSFEAVTLPAMLARAAAVYAHRPALHFLGAHLTYAQLTDQVDRFATALAGLGVVKGSRVAIQLPNLPQTVIAYHAVQRLGGHVVLTNPLYTPREIEEQWTDAGCRVAVVMDFVFEQKIRAARGRLPIEHYIVASIPEYLRFPLNLIAPLKLKRAKPAAMWAKVAPGPGIHFFKPLATRTPPTPPDVAIGIDDIAVLQYTGGTTGTAKAAMLSHRNISCNVQQMEAWLAPVTPGEEVVLAALPIFHVFGMTVGVAMTVRLAAAMAIVPNPRDIPAIINTIEKLRVTIAPLTPAHFVAINQTPGIEQRDLASARTCVSGSAPLSVDVLQRFEKLTRGKITEGFGLTETSPLTHINPIKGVRKVGTIGVPVPNTDARIVDADTGADVPPGTAGELLIKGPQVMTGYWNRPEETAATLQDGWLRTGDLATMDSDGYFTIVGRKKEMIATSGLKVYPDEVDRVMMSHPAVLEAATIGVPDMKRGEMVKSFVVLKPGRTATAEELTEFCRVGLAPYKVPRAIEFRSELPKSAILKILRRELRAQEIAKLAPAGQ